MTDNYQGSSEAAEKNEPLVFDVDRSELKNIKKQFFLKRSHCEFTDLLGALSPKDHNASERDKKLSTARINTPITFRCGDDRVEVLAKIDLRDGGEGKRYFRRLANEPGAILPLPVSNDVFKMIKHHFAGQGTENKVMEVGKIISAMRSADSDALFYDIYANAPCAFISEKGERLLAYYKWSLDGFRRVREPVSNPGNILDSIKTVGELAPQNEGQAFYYAFMKCGDITAVYADGVAGSGKTICALNAGILYKLPTVRVLRPTKEGGDELGYRKGGLQEKFGPFSMVVYDLMYKVLKLDPHEYPLMITEEELYSRKENGNGNGNGNGNKTGELKEAEQAIKAKKPVIVDVVNFMQGRNLIDEFVIVDEAQNISHNDLKMVMTRGLGKTRFACVGDSSQWQRKNTGDSSSGFLHHKKRLAGVNSVACINLPVCVRNDFGMELQAEIY